jgi:hypothetical protein
MMAKAEHQGGGDDQSFILYMQPGHYGPKYLIGEGIG